MESCDFQYELNGLHVGFNKEQIIDSAHGQKNCLLTLSVTSIDLIKQLKQAYGDYVTIIFSYTDAETLYDMTSRQAGISLEEVKERMNVSEKIKEVYLENIQWFDFVILYSETTVYSIDKLEPQYNYIIKKRQMIEKKLNNERYVELPYVGTGKYVFVSYSHKDKNEVYAILSRLQLNGFRIWYDEGIAGGSNWVNIIADKTKMCSCILLFSSMNSVESDEVSAEINCGRICKKQFITIRLDDARFSLAEEMYISKDQDINIDRSDYLEKIQIALPPENNMWWDTTGI